MAALIYHASESTQIADCVDNEVSQMNTSKSEHLIANCCCLTNKCVCLIFENNQCQYCDAYRR